MYVHSIVEISYTAYIIIYSWNVKSKEMPRHKIQMAIMKIGNSARQ